MAAEDVTLVATAGKAPSAPTFIDTVDVEGEASYTTGGLVIGLAALIGAGKSIQAVHVAPKIANANAKNGEYDAANDKLIAILASGAEVAATTDLTGQVLRLTVISR